MVYKSRFILCILSGLRMNIYEGQDDRRIVDRDRWGCGKQITLIKSALTHCKVLDAYFEL